MSKSCPISTLQSDCLFVLPLVGTVTRVLITVSDRMSETIILPKESSDVEGQMPASNAPRSLNRNPVLWLLTPIPADSLTWLLVCFLLQPQQLQ